MLGKLGDVYQWDSAIILAGVGPPPGFKTMYCPGTQQVPTFCETLRSAASWALGWAVVGVRGRKPGFLPNSEDESLRHRGQVYVLSGK